MCVNTIQLRPFFYTFISENGTLSYYFMMFSYENGTPPYENGTPPYDYTMFSYENDTLPYDFIPFSYENGAF